MKKKIIVISILVCILIVIGIILYSNDEIRFKYSYEYLNKVEYTNGKKIKVFIPWDNRIKYLNEKKLLDFLDNGTGVLYFGYNSCPWCRNIVPILIDASKKNKIDTIYYVDTHKLKNSSIKDSLFQKLDSYLEKDSEGKNVLAVPCVYFLKDGNIVKNHLGTIESYHDPYTPMTDSQKEELYNIYDSYIKEIK